MIKKGKYFGEPGTLGPIIKNGSDEPPPNMPKTPPSPAVGFDSPAKSTNAPPPPLSDGKSIESGSEPDKDDFPGY